VPCPYGWRSGRLCEGTACRAPTGGVLDAFARARQGRAPTALRGARRAVPLRVAFWAPLREQSLRPLRSLLPLRPLREHLCPLCGLCVNNLCALCFLCGLCVSIFAPLCGLCVSNLCVKGSNPQPTHQTRQRSTSPRTGSRLAINATKSATSRPLAI
jgi:hypothetical protein